MCSARDMSSTRYTPLCACDMRLAARDMSPSVTRYAPYGARYVRFANVKEDFLAARCHLEWSEAEPKPEGQMRSIWISGGLRENQFN